MRKAQRRSQGQSRRLVKNKLRIGDAKLTATVRNDQRAVGSQYADYNKINKSNVGLQNFYADALPKAKRQPLVDGTKFKKEIKAKGQRAAEVYGSRSKALANSYRRDKTTGEKIKPKKTERGGLKTNKPRNKGLI